MTKHRNIDERLYLRYLENRLSDESKVIFKKWLMAEDFYSKQREATRIYRDCIPELVQDIFDDLKLKAFARNIGSFEKLIQLTRGEIAGKFYRDHLNHMIRVYLLSLDILQKMKFNNEKILTAIKLASIFHDIAYPVQEAELMLRSISEALSKCYKSVKITSPGREIISESEIRDLLWLLNQRIKEKFSSDLSIFLESRLYDSLLRLKHGILGAIETGLMIRKEEREKSHILDALLAIALHDHEVLSSLKNGKRGVDMDLFPELFILILSDELQEWGRPMLTEEGYLYVVMEDMPDPLVYLKEGAFKIETMLDYSRCLKGFSPLLQIKSKINNLEYLNTNKASVRIYFKLPLYKLFHNRFFRSYRTYDGLIVSSAFAKYYQGLKQFNAIICDLEEINSWYLLLDDYKCEIRIEDIVDILGDLRKSVWIYDDFSVKDRIDSTLWTISLRWSKNISDKDYDIELRDNVLVMKVEKELATWEGPQLIAKERGFNKIEAKVMLDFHKSTSKEGNINLTAVRDDFSYVLGIDKRTEGIFFHCFYKGRKLRKRIHLEYLPENIIRDWMILGIEWDEEGKVKYFVNDEEFEYSTKNLNIYYKMAKNAKKIHMDGVDEFFIRVQLATPHERRNLTKKSIVGYVDYIKVRFAPNFLKLFNLNYDTGNYLAKGE